MSDNRGILYIALFNFVTTLNSLIFPARQYFLIYSNKGLCQYVPHTPPDHRHTDKYIGLVMNKQTDKRTDGRTLPSALSPCFAVDKYILEYCKIFWLKIYVLRCNGISFHTHKKVKHFLILPQNNNDHLLCNEGREREKGEFRLLNMRVVLLGMIEPVQNKQSGLEV